LVISQPQEALYIQVPMFDTSVTIQMTVNGLWRNATHAERAAFGSGAVESLDLGTDFTLEDASNVTGWQIRGHSPLLHESKKPGINCQARIL
jgi:hypothetical protein